MARHAHIEDLAAVPGVSWQALAEAGAPDDPSVDGAALLAEVGSPSPSPAPSPSPSPSPGQAPTPAPLDTSLRDDPIRIGPLLATAADFGAGALAAGVRAAVTTTLESGGTARGFEVADDGDTLIWPHAVPAAGACGVWAVPEDSAEGILWDRKLYMHHAAYRTRQVRIETSTGTAETIEMRWGRAAAPAAWASGTAYAVGGRVSARSRWHECIEAHVSTSGDAATGEPYQTSQTGWKEIPRARRYAPYGVGDSVAAGLALHYYLAVTDDPPLYEVEISDVDAENLSTGWSDLGFEEPDIVNDYALAADPWSSEIRLPQSGLWLLKPWIRLADNAADVSGGVGANVIESGGDRDSGTADFAWQFDKAPSSGTQRTYFRHPGIERRFAVGSPVGTYVFLNTAETLSKWGIYARRLGS